MFKIITDWDEAKLLNDAGLLWYGDITSEDYPPELNESDDFGPESAYEESDVEHWLTKGLYSVYLE